MLPVNCALPERCSMCTLTKGEPAGHNFQGSGCNNCNTYQSTKLAIPALPFTIANVDGTVKAEITAVDYVFYNEYVYIRFSGKKTYDAQNGGKNAISVPITLKNTINNTVHSKVTLEIKDLAVGDKFENVLLTMDGVDQLISDYAFFY